MQGKSGSLPIHSSPPASRRSVLGVFTTAALAAGAASPAFPLAPANAATNKAFVTPEQFGAVGDGMNDDAPALQRALDALASGEGGTLWLQADTAYRCRTGLTLDASRVSLNGHALLDFDGWTGQCLRITASSVAVRGREAANSYGHKGMISGAIRLRGGGRNTSSIGIDFDSPEAGTNAAMLVENLSIFNCSTGIRFGSRAYNSVLVRCEIFNCETCVAWGSADDNGERNTLVGCVLYNSSLAISIALGSATLHLYGCSLDYTTRIYDVKGGAILASSCHHESSGWDDRPIRCSGDGSFIRLDGGTIVNQSVPWRANHLIEVGERAAVHVAGMFVHNLALTPADPTYPACLAVGAGDLVLSGAQSYDASILPPRVHAGRTQLCDPDFQAENWEDTVWRVADSVMPIVDRYGSGADGLKLIKATGGGLVAHKIGRAGTPAAFILLTLPVRYGDAVLAGFRARSGLPRTAADVPLLVSPTWMKLEGQDARHVPIITKAQSVGTVAIAASTDRFVPVMPLGSRAQRTAPRWATHFCLLLDLSRAGETSVLFNGLWADTI